MAILAPKRFVRQNFKIPFYESNSGLSRLKIRVSPRLKNKEDQRSSITELRAEAKVYYITHYFPEFYAYLYNPTAFQEMLPENEGLELAEDLVADITRTIMVENYFNAAPPHTNKSIVIFKTTYDFAKKRKELLAEDKMPDFAANQEFFREKNNITGPTSAISLTIATLNGQNNALNNGLHIFGQEYANFAEQLSVNLDFTTAQNSVQKVLNTHAGNILQQLRKSSDKKLTDADTLTLEFGKKGNKAAVVGVSYLLVEESIESTALKVGNFSAVLYSRAFSDPLTVAILQNYNNIVSGADRAGMDVPPGGIPSSFSFYDFIRDPSVTDALVGGGGTMFSNPDLFTTGSSPGSFPRPLTPAELRSREEEDLQNEYIKAARSLGVISANDVQALTKGFKEAYTTEELARIKEAIENNPDVVGHVFKAQVAKKLTKAAKTMSMIENLLQEGPLGLMDKSPEGRRVKRFFKAFGIDQIMKEVMLCLTFGFNFEASRIASASAAATQSLQNQALSQYYRPPELPKPFMEIPKFDPKMFRPKLRDGNIGEIIKKAVIDALVESALGVVKKLAELISEVCQFNNPGANDYGANDINTLISEEGLMSGLDGLALNNNLDPQILRAYLSALSGMLSSVDICNLFSPISTPPDSLIGRIITFNEEYDNIFIQQGLTDISSLMGFINELSAFVDVADLCDEIANMAYVLNQDDVCLALEDAPDLGELVVDVPELNFDCMDKENFINDPTITKTIPEVFNMVAETVEVQFIKSADTIREILLQPILIRGTNSNVLTSLDDAERFREGGTVDVKDSLEEPDSNALGAIQDNIKETLTLLNSGQAGLDIAQQLFADCKPHPQEVLGIPDPDVFINLFKEIAATLAASSFNSELRGLSDQIGTLAEGSGVVVRTYRFRQDFYEDFKGYVRTHYATFVDTTYTAPNYFSSTRVAAAAGVSMNATPAILTITP